MHLQQIVDAPSAGYDKSEKAKAQGFIKIWQPSSLQTWLTAFMVDVWSVFRYVEKEAQKDEIIIPDVLRYRDIALQKLKLLENKPYPCNKDFIRNQDFVSIQSFLIVGELCYLKLLTDRKGSYLNPSCNQAKNLN